MFKIHKKSDTIVFHTPLFLIIKSFLKLYVCIGFILRIILLFTAPEGASISFWEAIRTFIVGALGDLGMGMLVTLPLLFIHLGLNEWKYNKKVGWSIEGLLVIFFCYTMFTNSIFDEYGGGAPMIAKILLSYKLASFSLRFFIPSIRKKWRSISIYVAWTIYVMLMLTVSLGEFFFWQEFGVRYNFIAVDYLVYTNEVIGNIMESYSITPLIICIVLATGGIIYYQSFRDRFKLENLYTPKQLILQVGLYLSACLVGVLFLFGVNNLSSDNQLVSQLEQNGACDFCIAFQNNKLEYDHFYAMMPEKQCRFMYHELSKQNKDEEDSVISKSVKYHPNIVLITVESLSAEFLKQYGDTANLTPNLNQLMGKSLVFDNLYAVGNRTVRGLEALSLCIPPSAGESIIKRPNNKMGKLSVGYQLTNIGYQVQFLYGGDSYFDNMKDYFSHNNYEVIDRKIFKPEEITFKNIWGVCDEDMFNKSLKVFDKDAQKGKPFYAQIMTTSNHRPYTYPAGKIHMDGNPKCREGGVKYTYYAIGKFLRDAQNKPWFSNTVFIVIADHCASSAGKTSINIDKYHIPCIVYAPNIIAPKHINKICSQIDLMPTLFNVLHLPCNTQFTGTNILSKYYHQRAFMATYQDLGYLENGVLTVLSPVRKIEQYQVTPLKDHTFKETPLSQHRYTLIKEAQAYYQYAHLYIKAVK